MGIDHKKWPADPNLTYIKRAEKFLPHAEHSIDIIVQVESCISSDARLAQEEKEKFLLILDIVCLQPDRAFSYEEKIILGKALVLYLGESDNPPG